MFPYLRTVEQFLNDCKKYQYKTECTDDKKGSNGNYPLENCLNKLEQVVTQEDPIECKCHQCSAESNNKDCLNCKQESIGEYCLKCEWISILVNWLIRSVDRSNWSGRDPGKLGSIGRGEIEAWCHSLNHHMYDVLNQLSQSDDKYKKNLSVGLEYFIDNRAYEGETGIRADVLIGGYGYWEGEQEDNATPHKRIVVIEIKQWGDDEQVNRPIEQVENYCKKLRLSIDDHVDSQRDPIEIIPCVFMHEVTKKKKTGFSREKFNSYDHAFCYGNTIIPVFMNGSEGNFTDYLKKIFNGTDNHNGKEVFKALKNRIKTFSTDELSALLTCKQEQVKDAINHLHPDQYYAYNRIKRQLLLYKLNKDGIFDEVIKGAFNSVCDDENYYLETLATKYRSSYIQELHDTLRISRRDSLLRKVYLCILLRQILNGSEKTKYLRYAKALINDKNIKNCKVEGTCKTIERIISKHEMLNDYYHDLNSFGVNFSEKPKPADFVFGGPGSGKTLLTVLLLRYCVDLGIKVAVLSAANTPLKSNILPNYITENDEAKKPNEIRAKKFIQYCFWRDVSSKLKKHDIIMFDEAHLFGKNTENGNEENKKDEINEFNLTDYFSPVFSIFLLDRKQFIDEITKIGKTRIDEYKKNVKKLEKATELHLWSQFRCGCDEGYITWVEQLLGISDGELRLQGDQKDYDEPLYIDDLDMEVNAIESENEIDKLLKKKVLCVTGKEYWDKCEGKFDKRKVIVNPNEKNKKIEKIIKPLNNIHDVQGLEKDEVLVIIGDEFKVDDKEKKLVINDIEKAEYIKNEYRVLLTRGLKKCYILCVDPGVRKVVASKLKRPKGK